MHSRPPIWDLIVIVVQLGAIGYMLYACSVINRTRKKLQEINELLDKEFENVSRR